MVDKGCGFDADSCVTLARAGRLEELKVKLGQFDCTDWAVLCRVFSGSWSTTAG
jgi:hypothetical protein